MCGREIKVIYESLGGELLRDEVALILLPFSLSLSSVLARHLGVAYFCSSQFHVLEPFIFMQSSICSWGRVDNIYSITLIKVYESKVKYRPTIMKNLKIVKTL